MPISTWLEGVCCKPIAWRKIESTTIIRVNEVSIITMAGKKLSDVISSKICIVTEYSVEPSAAVFTVTAGNTPSAAPTDTLKNKMASPINGKLYFVIVLISPDVSDSQRNQIPLGWARLIYQSNSLVVHSPQVNIAALQLEQALAVLFVQVKSPRGS